MGTLYNQLPREQRLTVNRVTEFGYEIQDIADELDISFADAIALYLACAKVDNYDSRDEQLAGFGELVNRFIGAYKQVSGVA